MFWFLSGVLVAVAASLVIYPLLLMRHAAPAATDAVAAHVNGNASPGQSMDGAIAALEQRLAKGGGSDADWELLARSYEFVQRPEAAAAAREKRLLPGAGVTLAPSAPSEPSAAARKLITSADAARSRHDLAAAAADYRQLATMQEMTADTWADYADVAAGLNGNSLIGEPEKYLQAALRLDPRHPKALWLEGSLQHETGQYTQAVTTWQKLAGVLGPDSPDAKVIAANLAEDQRLAGPAPAAVAIAAGSGVAVRGEVLLSDALRPRVSSGLTLFIVAKSVNSPGPPVAILRTTTGNWPVTFELTDALAMMPDRKLSTAGLVTIEARVSKSGQAMPQSGDLLGVTAPVDPAAGKPVRIVIERVIGS
ncbi:MAG: tetratricopeptide repeat protein [Steroidobacteraceae bacterium]